MKLSFVIFCCTALHQHSSLRCINKAEINTIKLKNQVHHSEYCIKTLKCVLKNKLKSKKSMFPIYLNLLQNIAAKRPGVIGNKAHLLLI
jgi:hypothetical protein